MVGQSLEIPDEMPSLSREESNQVGIFTTRS